MYIEATDGVSFPAIYAWKLQRSKSLGFHYRGQGTSGPVAGIMYLLQEEDVCVYCIFPVLLSFYLLTSSLRWSRLEMDGNESKCSCGESHRSQF